MELEKYPHVKEAVIKPGNEIKLPFDRTENTSEFARILLNNQTDYIKIDNKYYEMHFYSAD